LAEDPWLLGALTALLPCSALAAAAITAAAQGSALGGAATMVTFATLTGLALLGVTSLSGWAKRALSDRALSVVLALGALVMAVRPLPMLSQAHQTSCHDLSVSEGTP
jgi:sulfite exporter TauE/SafE